MTTVISIENLSKIYRLGQIGTGTFTNDLKVWWAKVRGKPDPMLRIGEVDHGNREIEELWALRDVSFTIEQGEVLGVIGRNGAGKSTLLKILSRVTAPSSGRIKVKGRIASLLEVGTGFHPELTGRENIYLNGAILGMNRREIDRKFDEIVGFAEVEKFIDTPVKRYSSGMYVRLAFAVAAHLDPEILIVDEVLAVGDAEFQDKCLGKMGDVAKDGRTIIFVSHNMAAIASLCNNCMQLEQGKIIAIGPTQTIIEDYLETISCQPASYDLSTRDTRKGTGEARIKSISVLDKLGNQSSVFQYGDDICFEFTIEPISGLQKMMCVVWIHTSTGIPVLHLVSSDDPEWSPFQARKTTTVRCLLENCELYPGTYFASIWVGPSHYQATDFVEKIVQFKIEQGELLLRGFQMNWKMGLYFKKSTWKISEEQDINR